MFTGPELAVLMAYSKITLYDELLASDVPDDPYFASTLEHYFPTPLRERFPDAVGAHPLRREIVANCLANELVNRCGVLFVFALQEESGASAPDIVRAYAAAAEVLGLSRLWADIEALDDQVATETQRPCSSPPPGCSCIPSSGSSTTVRPLSTSRPPLPSSRRRPT
jgi:glutamate dehydrogenase